MSERFPKADWRLLITPPARGAWNMAVDEAVQAGCGQGASPPTLRLYAWDPPCLSLGYTQPFSDVDSQALARAGWDLVRRPTGGRAILHTDELTYSVCAHQDEPRLAGSVLESYRRLAQALLAALHGLDIPAQALPEPAGAVHPTSGHAEPVCFEAPSNYEITVNGKKLIGSAQSRRMGAVLQHGSLPLGGDLTRITRALAYPEEEHRQQAAQRLLQRAATAEAALGRQIEWSQAAEAFVQAFAKTLNLELTAGELSETEQVQAHTLVQEKYSSQVWTERIE
jgi:lipoyl(octanoyl) transferase